MSIFVCLVLLLATLCSPTLAYAAAPPGVVTGAEDTITPVGDPALPDKGAASDAGQGVREAIDGGGKKYYNRSRYGGGYGGSGFVVTPDRGATVVTGLALKSGDDTPGRDPASFSLFGSNDGGKTFTPLVTDRAVPAFTERNERQTVSFANAKAYTTYKLIFPTVAGGPDMQVDEADLIGVPVPGAAATRAAEDAPPAGALTLWYTRPAASAMEEALPVGNGRMGGLVFGGVADERVVLNEDSLWTGGENSSGDYGSMGGYQTLGDLRLHLDGADAPTHYRRSLDLARAQAEVVYRANGIQYRREYFASHPDQVLVVHLTADRPGSYSGSLALTDAHGGTVTAEGHTLGFMGALPNGIRYGARLAVLHQGGTVTVTGDHLVFANCDSLTLLVGAGTNYVMDPARNYLGDDPAPRVARQVEAAGGKSVSALQAAHLADYAPLFGRVHLDLGASPAARRSLPMDKRKVLAASGDDPELEQLLFQYGRYLLISCSRPGSLPANLQGLWNDSNDAPWHSDYHANINVQMNYWPAEVTNLSECQLPFLDLVVRANCRPGASPPRPPRRSMKTGVGGAVPTRGFAIRTSHNITGGLGWNWDKTANAWYCQHFWEHYAFTGDKAISCGTTGLSADSQRNCTQFWEDHLKTLPDGRLVVPERLVARTRPD